MFERIKILTLLQLSNKTKRFEQGSKRIYAFLAIRALIIIVLSVVVSLIIYFLKNILFIPTNEYFMIAVLILTQGLNIIVAITSLTGDMYNSKDNQILFSLPVKSDEVYISKMIVYYINEFIRNLFIIFPLLIAFGVNNKLMFWFYFQIIPILFILPFLSVGLSALLSIPIGYIKNFLRQQPIITFILILAVFGGLFYLTFTIINKIPTPIRIVQLYNKFILSLTLTLYKIASIGTIYTVIGKMLVGVNYFINLLILIATVLGIAGLNYFISKPIYFSLVSQSSDNTVKRTEKRKPFETKHMFFNFFNKEFKIARRTPNELISNYSLLLSLPFFMYILNYIYMGINRSTLGNRFVLIFNIFVSLLIVTSSNTASATAITTEGYEFILLKTAPYKTSKMAWAKIAFNVLFTTITITLSFILFAQALPVFPKKDIWLLYFLVNLVNIGHILLSFQIDLLNPKLSDYAVQGTLAHNDNVSKSLATGLVTTLIFGILALILFIFMNNMAWIILYGLAISLLTYRLISFNSYLNAYFVDIEY